jgi:hypothetical protein
MGQQNILPEPEQHACSMPNWDHRTYSKDPDIAHQQYLHLLDEHSDDYD